MENPPSRNCSFVYRWENQPRETFRPRLMTPEGKRIQSLKLYNLFLYVFHVSIIYRLGQEEQIPETNHNFTAKSNKTPEKWLINHPPPMGFVGFS